MGDELHVQEEKLINKFNQARSKMARNRLILVSFLNALTFFSFIFAMAFYEWIWIQLNFSQNRVHVESFYFWVNLLYLKQDAPGSEYQNFGTAQRRICSTDIYCKAIFYSFSFVGYLCFSIFIIAGFLQMFDFIRIFYLMFRSSQLFQKKDNFRHIVTIATYTLGLTLSAYSIAITNQKFRFGVSFWICVGTLIMFIVVIIYEQISIRKMIKQSLIQELIDKEIQTRAKKIKQVNIEMPTIQQQKDQGLTL